MANNLSQDPLVIDTTATDIKCPRIRALKYDQAAGAGAVSIVDGTTGHRIWSTDDTCFDDINLTVPGDELVIDVTITGGTLYIYLGSGPR